MNSTHWWSFPATCLLVLLSVLGLAACQSAGDIAVELDDPGYTHISPRNQDGVQDRFVVPAAVLPVERSVITRARLEVIDVGGNAIYTQEQQAPPRRFAWFRRQNGIATPDILVWDGTTDTGAWAPDGPYQLAFTVSDNRERNTRLDDLTVVVDNRPPFVEPTLAFPAFSPNGDGRLDTITIFQRRATVEDSWIAEMQDSGGTVVRTWRWTGALPDLTWDGTDAEGALLPSDSYTYHIRSTDRAGNAASFTAPVITLDVRSREASVTLGAQVFSPNGDGQQDTVAVRLEGTDRAAVETASLTVVDVRGAVVRNLRLRVDTRELVFDGRADDGSVLPDGGYRVVLSGRYRNGDLLQTASPLLMVDTAPPAATVAAEYRLFSPDGDGRRDAVRIRHSLGLDASAEGVLRDAAGREVRRLTWTGGDHDLIWDGTDATGQLVADGLYRYELQATDEAGNRRSAAVDLIRVDTRPVPVTVEPLQTGFSPNGDGLFDTLTLRMTLPESVEVERWELAVVPAEAATGGATTDAGQAQVAGAVYRFGGTGAPLSTELVWTGSPGLADGLYEARLEVAFEKGNLASVRSRRFRVDTTAPEVQTRVTPERFSPDGDGVNDLLRVQLSVRDPSLIVAWAADIADPTGQEFWRTGGQRDLPDVLEWNGRSTTGELVQSTSLYPLAVSVTDIFGNTGRASDRITTDVLVLRDGETLRIVLSAITFAPFSADYLGVPPDQVRANLQALDRVAEVLARYPDQAIRIDGHAVSLLWADQVRARREQAEVLLPLSRARAEAIRRALIDRGIAASRITTRGLGGSQPVVPHGDELNRWKSRRVEFVLTPLD